MPSRLRSNIGTRISFFAFQDIITSVTGILILVALILALYLNTTSATPAIPEPSSQELEALQAELAKTSAHNQTRQASLIILGTAPSPARLQSDLAALQAQRTAQSNRLTALYEAAAARATEATNLAERLGLGALRERASQLERDRTMQQQANAALTAETRALEQTQQQLQQQVEQARSEHRLWLIPDTVPGGKNPVLVTITATNVAFERFNQPGQRRTLAASDVPRSFGTSLQQWNPAVDYLVFYVRPSGIELFRHCLTTARQSGFEVGFDAVEERKQIVFSTPAPP